MSKGLTTFLLIGVAFMLSFSPAAAFERNDSFIAGYATAVLERDFDLSECSLSVKDGVVTIRSRNLTGRTREKIIKALSGIQGVVRVEVSEVTPVSKADAVHAVPVVCKTQERGFFPRGELFAPLIADPRWPHFSAAYLNFIDDDAFKNVGAVSFGGGFPFYRGDFPFGGQWEMGAEAAVFSIFDLDAASHDLINSDFWVALPYLSYRNGIYSGHLRVFHQSSHLGDEYLLRNRVNRVNLSYEAVSLKLSYDFLNVFRLYGGGGYLFDCDPSDLKPWSTQVGLEFESPRSFLGEMARPVAAVDIQHRQETHWDTDLSIRAGVQLESPESLTRRYQLMLEFYRGHSPNGQFFERNIEYAGFGLHIYF